MHARETVELAMSIAIHVETLLEGSGAISDEGVDAYWAASKRRLDRWMGAFQTANGVLEADRTAESTTDQPFPNRESVNRVPARDAMLALAEEVLASEVLTRVWAAMLASAKHLAAHHAAVAAGRSIFLGHQEMRLRILKWMVESSNAGSPAVDALNLLRKKCERWTDMFLGRIQIATGTVEFGFDSQRVREYGRDFQSESDSGTLDASCKMVVGSVLSSLQSSLKLPPVCKAENIEISAAVLISFGPGILEEWGGSPWAWRHRVERAASEVERLVAELLAMETSQSN